MKLEPVYATGRAKATQAMKDVPVVSRPATTKQVRGVETARVETRSGRYTARLLGRVVPDERRIYRLNAGIEGYIQDIAESTTGAFVRKNQQLATFSSPSATMPLQTFILNVGAEERFQKALAEHSPEGVSLPAAAANIQQRIHQLQNLGMSLLQIDEVRKTRLVPDRIKILAPVDGIILSQNVYRGQKFDRGAEWYSIADLKHVWVIADVAAREAAALRRCSRVRISRPDGQGSLTAHVSETQPQIDEATRTVKVRIEADNTTLALRPNMFVDVYLDNPLPAALSVFADSVVDSGTRKVVFVDTGDGQFEPREVEIGWRSGDSVGIVRGLSAGDRVARDANFLLDSETRMQVKDVAWQH